MSFIVTLPYGQLVRQQNCIWVEMLLAEISMAKELIVEVTDKLLDILPQSRIFKPFFSLIPCSEICSHPFSTSIRLNSKKSGYMT